MQEHRNAKEQNGVLMKTKIVGLMDDLVDYEIEEISDGMVAVVYNYEEGCYEGNGKAYGLDAQGSVYEMNLGHCSCYGPTDDGWGDPVITVQDFIEGKDPDMPDRIRVEEDCDWDLFVKAKEVFQECLG